MASGHAEKAAFVIDEVLARAAERGETYELPDLLRAQGEILLALPCPDLAGAEHALLRALVSARTQSAPGWELRAAMPLARLWLAQGRSVEAEQLLQDVLRQFGEGSYCPRLKSAGGLLWSIRHVNG